MSELPILLQDDYLVAIDKPSGLLVHRSWIAKQETEFALQQVRDQIGQHVYPVHRLDRPTSGILLFAKDPDTARLMTGQFTAREVRKTYHAVVRGYLDSGTLDYPLKEELDRIADKQADPDKLAQPAVTDYVCLQQIELPFAVSKKHATSRYSLMRLHPHTGRKHQLRRHMSHLRHPIIGDTNHGDGRHNRFFQQHFDLRRLLLAATGLAFTHPHTKTAVQIELPIPEELLRPFETAAD
ncbi:pseudouridine synthase [Pseudidiomarina salinarum]|uniref:tRNA pseudouridine synthase C n=1 Tax=Pseudidiomarina salinarum TaxID=435908 RepID=A0A094IVJ0_9GAMM|nr:tRNA pseudouridine(65) synthase TruC [Pseudidiomarina salinarum]KFZ31700.1 pseudouridine synthase [Pseudidiomarina salinarum]RUO70528.1 tRNA pseudouridine(65) synthase TruC [Pseudidiomarina salinarum]